MSEVILVNADKLIRQFETCKANAHPLDYNTKATYAECITMVKAAETIDAEPVRHGRWRINMEFADYECSVCKQGDVISPYFERLKMNYCPNCGAKMDGGKKE